MVSKGSDSITLVGHVESCEVLLAGESWTNLTFSIKGRDVSAQSSYVEAADHLIAALETAGATVTFQPCHVAANRFPESIEELEEFDMVILSDIGADTLQLTPQVARGKAHVDRLHVLKQYVSNGGALGMIGGYTSFSGYAGMARYGRSPIEPVLPVKLIEGDDRVELPAGEHPQGSIDRLPTRWPEVLGYNKTTPRAGADVLATINSDPLLVVDSYQDGAAFAFTTDCAPHWAPQGFLEWDGFPVLWEHIIETVA